MLINKNFTTKDLLNFLISFLPLSIILGNLAINLNVILICVLGLIMYRFQVFTLDKKIYQYLIYSFFLYLVLITFYRNFPNLDTNPLYKENMIKSLLFLRFLILFFVVNKLVEDGDFNVNLFFISASFLSFFLALDILIQVKTGTDVFGYSITLNRPSGFFGDENIAGGYLQKFSFFFIFSGVIFLFKSLRQNLVFIILSLVLFFISIVLTGNRMPFLIYLASIILLIFLEKKMRKFIFFSIFFSFVFFFIIIKNSPMVKDSFQSFRTSVVQITLLAPKLFYSKEIEEEVSFNNGYLIVFNSSIQLWKENKLFGSGLKSFRINCEHGHNKACQSHPHNYFLELILDVGLVGLILIYFFFALIVNNFFKFYYKNDLRTRIVFMPFFLILFFEFFPLRSSGSFFTTSNAVLIFLLLPVLMGVNKINKNK